MSLRGTLAVLAALATVVACVVVAALLDQWGDSLLVASERLRQTASRRAETLVERTLDGAAAAALGVAAPTRDGSLDVRDRARVRSALMGQMLGNSDLAEATVTLLDGPVRQISVARETEPTLRLTVRELGPREMNPTEDLTFTSTLEHHRFTDEPLWTDLHYSDLDASLPEGERRVVVTVMQVLVNPRGRTLGVVRIGLLADRLDRILSTPVDGGDPDDPHRMLLADDRGRLVAPRVQGMPLEDMEGDLRPSPAVIPEDARAALSQPAVRDAVAGAPRQSGRFESSGRFFLLSAAHVPGAQNWRVVIFVPEDHYLGDLERTRRMLLWGSVGALALLVFVGAVVGRSVSRSVEAILASTSRMSAFDFAARVVPTSFRDVRAVLLDLEQAKTALRALGKYVPIDLVRRLYSERREPRLGGEVRDMTVMFTDIENFTGFAEGVEPDVLASVLAGYLERMTAAVHASGGTVDKYIGDAVMAFWNAPEPVDRHAARACAAALRCASSAGAGDGFKTRFGLHRADVMVGHFGAADRLSYTVIGDGVNLASRLEALNKTYGTTILVSESVRESVGAAFEFRTVDAVAVKGKRQGVLIFELLGPAGSVEATARAVVEKYEAALAAYQGKRFAEALATLEVLVDDGPSRVLAKRCRRFLEAPPPEPWSGVWIAETK